MGQKSGFFTSNSGDRNYGADWLAQYIAGIVSNGVYTTELTTTGGNGDMSVTVSAGRAWINGYMYSNDSSIKLPLSVADGALSRTDLVVLRLDMTNRQITLAVVQGTFGGGVPAITRTADIYELELAQVAVAAGTTAITQAMITDKRLDNSACGIVHGVVQQVDTTTLYNQIQNDLANFKSGSETDFDTWKSQFQSDLTSWKSTSEFDFNTWLSSVQGILNEDEAGNLLNLINGKADKTHASTHAIGGTDALKSTDLGIDATTAAKFFASVAGTESVDQVLSKLGNGSLLSSVDYTNHTTRNVQISSTYSVDLQSIVKAGSTLVAVGTDSMGNYSGFTSSDLGETWTARSLPSSGWWRALAYSPTLNRVIAVTGGNSEAQSAAAYSNDGGISWGSVTLPLSDVWYAATWGLDRFILVGENYALYSLNGTTWNQITGFPTNKYFEDIIFADNKFVTISANGYSAISTDGITWTLSSFITGGFAGRNIAYGNGKFVAISTDSTSKAAYSSDGLNWTVVSLPTISASVSWSGLVFGDGMFIAVTYGTSVSDVKCIYSIDGITWELFSLVPSTLSTYNKPLYISDGKFLFPAYSGTLAVVQTEYFTSKVLSDCLDTVSIIPAGIDIGSYVGTGTYGQSSPCTLPCRGLPKMLYIQKRGSLVSVIANLAGNSGTSIVAASTIYSLNCSRSANEGSWWSLHSAGAQCNEANAMYDYILMY